MATILVVDDEKHIRNHLATYIRGEGYAVETAADAAAALALLDRGAIDVVVSDVRMAGMDGLALLGKTASKPRPCGESASAMESTDGTSAQAIHSGHPAHRRHQPDGNLHVTRGWLG